MREIEILSIHKGVAVEGSWVLHNPPMGQVLEMAVSLSIHLMSNQR